MVIDFMTLMGVITVVVVLLIIFVFFTFKGKEYHLEAINTTSDLILIYENNKLIEANNAFYTYFSQFTSIEDMKKNDECISDFFEEAEGYIQAQTLEGVSWMDAIKETKDAKVKIGIGKKKYYFSIKSTNLGQNRVAVVLSDISKEIQYKEEIRQLTYQDAITHVGNRRHFDIKLKNEIAVAQRYKHSISLVMLEIDDFNNLYEIHGETFTNRLQLASAKLISSQLREVDVFCRFSGTKFIIILPFTDLEGARKVAQKLSFAVASSQKVLPITMSFGVATYHDGDEIDLCLSKADNALVKAKEMGTNRIVLG
jgi:diguanylate cyclase (GGDEF)-like protein